MCISRKSSGLVQAAIREKRRQDKMLDEKNYRSALGGYRGCFPVIGTFSYPRPSYIANDGARVWCFGA